MQSKEFNLDAANHKLKIMLELCAAGVMLYYFHHFSKDSLTLSAFKALDLWIINNPNATPSFKTFFENSQKIAMPVDEQGDFSQFVFDKLSFKQKLEFLDAYDQYVSKYTGAGWLHLTTNQQMQFKDFEEALRRTHDGGRIIDVTNSSGVVSIIIWIASIFFIASAIFSIFKLFNNKDVELSKSEKSCHEKYNNNPPSYGDTNQSLKDFTFDEWDKSRNNEKTTI